MNILIRLPNWLGDMVMSSAFVRAVKEIYPDAIVDLIAKKGIDVLLDFFPVHNDRYVFSKEDYSGLSGAWKFGRQIAKKKKYDIFFCLPDSFSSAVMGYASGASKRTGYKKEARGILLTSSFHKRKNLHRVQEYMDLLQQYTGKQSAEPVVSLSAPAPEKTNAIVININSEAGSRRLPEEKAVSIINAVRKNCEGTIFLTGSPKDIPFVEGVYTKLQDRSGIIITAGTIPLPELAGFLKGAAAVLTTDSGPAHLANAVGTHTIVLFGAGNENNTAPYNKDACTIIRLNKLSCEPCTSNTCKKYGIPQCLLQLDEALIVQEMQSALKRVTSRQ